MKKYLTPLAVLFVSDWLVVLENKLLNGSVCTLFRTLSIAFALFALGVSLQSRRKNKTWVKKLIVSFVFLFLMLYDIGVLKITIIEQVFSIAAIQQFSLYALYVYLGWMFFD